MAIFQHIPQAMLQSIGFMALLFLCYEAIQFWNKTSSKQNYFIASAFYVIALVHFFVEIFAASYLSIPKIVWPIAVANQIQWVAYLGMGYLVIITGYLLHFVYRWTKLLQLKKNADYHVAMDLKHWVKSQMDITGSRRKIQIGFSNSINGPVTFGWLEPIILMPFSILNQLSTEEIKFILLHEIAHIIRYDFILHVFLELAKIILCFNPFAYYFSNKIMLEREKSCDDWVVANTHAPLLYTKALYQLAKYNYTNHNSLSLAAAEKVSALMIRIKHINGLKPAVHASFQFWPKFLIGISLASLILFNIHLVVPSIENKQTKQTLIVASIKPAKQVVVPVVAVISSTTKRLQKTKAIDPIVFNKNPISTDSNYQGLVAATIDWINARSGNNNSKVSLANFDANKDTPDYSVAEQLLLRAVLHKYELKRAIIANTIAKANNQEEAIRLVKNSKEWMELQQYEKWANSFLKQHPMQADSNLRLTDF